MGQEKTVPAKMADERSNRQRKSKARELINVGNNPIGIRKIVNGRKRIKDPERYRAYNRKSALKRKLTVKLKSTDRDLKSECVRTKDRTKDTRKTLRLNANKHGTVTNEEKIRYANKGKRLTTV